MLAIITKYHGPTNFKGSRIIASVAEPGPGRRQVTRHYDDALNADANHMYAARALAQKLGWSGTWYMGSTQDGYVFVRKTPHTGDYFILAPVECMNGGAM